MGLLHLIDRPGALAENPRRHALSAAISTGSHVLLAVIAIVLLRSAPAREAADAALKLDIGRVVWLPNPADGGGRDGGGDRSVQPARRAQVRGDNNVSVPAQPQPSSTSLADSPIDPISISARPMGDSHQALVGSVSSESPSDVLGRNTGPGGDGNGPTPGTGDGPRGFGEGLNLGGPGVSTPVVIQQVKPQYTADAMRAKLQGAVLLECIVLADGSVGDVRVRRSLDSRFGLDEEAVAAAKRWRFKPGLLNGQPVPVAITIELTFTLR